MSLPVNHLYEFGEFRLDTREKVLLRGDQQVELTPKGFDLLSVFVENHGRLLEKEELMEKVWADSFVEDSNLTFNIRQLRVVLGDDAQEPKYIKTVRRHGYRFIANVKQIEAEDKLQDEAGTLVVLQPDKIHISAMPVELPKTSKHFVPFLLSFVLLLIAIVLIGSWYVRSKSFQPYAPVLAAPLSSEKLSTNGKVVFAALSPNGKNVFYTNGTGTDKQSVWLRQIDTGGSIEIIPPSDERYFGLGVSPDGNQLFFVRKPAVEKEPLGVYHVSIFGGIPQKILSETEGWISLSPDGTKISFVRCYYRDDEYCSLWTADSADGKNERKILSRPRPVRIGDNKFSPDGKTIVFAVGQSATASNEFGLAEVDLESGTERAFTNDKFFNVKNMAWLPDKSGLLITASRVPSPNYRIWQVSAANGETKPLTKDSESYSIMGLDKDATKIISTQVRQDFHLRLISLDDPSANRTLTDASSVSIGPDGKIYFSSIMSGNDEIWSINADGSGQRQLTNNPADEAVPVVSPDNNFIFFVSNRTGDAQMWRMNADGSNQTQITHKEGGTPIFVSPDGEWVYYRHNLTSKLWRVPAKGGDEQLVLDKPKGRFGISPDGSQVSYSERQGDERILTIATLADGQVVKAFRLADPKALLLQMVWLPDGKNLAYVSANRDFQNNFLWLQSLDGGPPRPIAALGNDEINEGFSFAVSPDGKTFAIVQGKWLHDAILFAGLH